MRREIVLIVSFRKDTSELSPGETEKLITFSSKATKSVHFVESAYDDIHVTRELALKRTEEVVFFLRRRNIKAVPVEPKRVLGLSFNDTQDKVFVYTVKSNKDEYG